MSISMHKHMNGYSRMLWSRRTLIFLLSKAPSSAQTFDQNDSFKPLKEAKIDSKIADS